MIFDGRSYNVLVVSSSEKFNMSMSSILNDEKYNLVEYAGSVSEAKRILSGRSFDYIIINSPLPDETGIRLAIDSANSKNMVSLILVKADLFDETNERVTEQGVFTLPKPISTQSINLGLLWMSATRERLRKLQSKSSSLEDKMEEIRLVNRAKWLLIDKEQMTEEAAHKFIEKSAMDSSLTRKEIANNLIKQYS